MQNGLIGHTGFVGGNLAVQKRFDEFYNSRNIEQIAGRQFDLLVCSGVRAEKWIANANPEQDRKGILRLMQALETVQARQLVLISTVDVHQHPLLVDEDTPLELVETAPAYGKNRLELEQFVRERFNALVIRLPGLFGPGIKKNIIYDFLHGNQTDKIHSESVFQFYDLTRLWSDIEICRRAELQLVHFATEPVSVAEVARQGFGFNFSNAPVGKPARYDFRTKHASLFGGAEGYLFGRDELFRRLQMFVRTQTQRAA